MAFRAGLLKRKLCKFCFGVLNFMLQDHCTSRSLNERGTTLGLCCFVGGYMGLSVGDILVRSGVC